MSRLISTEPAKEHNPGGEVTPRELTHECAAWTDHIDVREPATTQAKGHRCTARQTATGRRERLRDQRVENRRWRQLQLLGDYECGGGRDKETDYGCYGQPRVNAIRPAPTLAA